MCAVHACLASRSGAIDHRREAAGAVTRKKTVVRASNRDEEVHVTVCSKQPDAALAQAFAVRSQGGGGEGGRRTAVELRAQDVPRYLPTLAVVDGPVAVLVCAGQPADLRVLCGLARVCEPAGPIAEEDLVVSVPSVGLATTAVVADVCPGPDPPKMAVQRPLWP